MGTDSFGRGERRAGKERDIGGARRRRREAMALGALALVACQPAPPPCSPCLELPAPEGEAVARVGDTPIVVEQIAERIRDQGRVAVRRYSDPKRLRRFVEDQVRFELLVRAGMERGLHRDPDVVEAARKVMVRKLLQHDMGEAVFETVSDEAIAGYYERHQSEYMQPEKRRIAEIPLAANEEGRVLAQTLIDRLSAHPLDRDLLTLLAGKHSVETKSGKTAGVADLFKTREQIAAEYGAGFAGDVFTGKSGAVVPHPVQSTWGWHVVKVHAVREALARGLEEVREDIRDHLHRGGRSAVFDEYLSDLKRRHPVTIYEARIEDVIAALEADPRPRSE